MKQSVQYLSLSESDGVCTLLLQAPPLNIITRGLLEELGLWGNRNFNELNRTHWAIKRVDLIQELYEAGIQVPIFNTQSEA